MGQGGARPTRVRVTGSVRHVHDLVIRGGTVVDGTGAPGRLADVAIDGDRVVAVGEVDGPAHRTHEADGLTVTPGFVDAHTHLDAQLGWDPEATPSCWHGVTSVVIGNCGVTFAPCRPQDRAWLAEMMESVEDIPADAILGGLPWDWESYGDYLDTVDRLPKGVNVGGMVGHCAIRWNVMGERSLDRSESPTADELEAMAAHVDEALERGALGVSSSRTIIHTLPDGREVPGTFAGLDELVALTDPLRRRGRGVFETAAMLGAQNGVDEEGTRHEIELLAAVSRACGRPVSFGLTHTNAGPHLHELALAHVTRVNADGARLRPQTSPRQIGVLIGLDFRTPFDFCAGWQALAPLSHDEKMAALADPERRAALVTEADALGNTGEHTFLMPLDRARYDHSPDDSLAAEAARRGVSVAQAFIDLNLESDGGRIFNYPFLNQDLEAAGAMFTHPDVVVGLGDAGAHVSQVIDASQATFLLSYWVRERGAFTLEDAVRRITSETAELFGLTGRGLLAPGAHADVNVLDPEALGLPLPEHVRDLPGGAGRLIQRAEGYRATIVNGQVALEDGEHTGTLAGRLLRSAS